MSLMMETVITFFAAAFERDVMMADRDHHAHPAMSHEQPRAMLPSGDSWAFIVRLRCEVVDRVAVMSMP